MERTTLPLVLLDATAVPTNLGGVGRYVVSLVREVGRRGAVRLVVAARPSAVEALRAAAPGVSVVAAPHHVERVPLRLLWEQVGLPVLARRLGADVVHSPHYTLPLLTGARRVVTLHDATFFSSPEWHRPVKARFFRAWTRLALRFADAVVTPSRATADELARWVRRPARRTAVAPLGVDGAVFHPPTATDRRALGDAVPDLPREWIAFLGTLEPRKNVPALIEAVRAVAVQRRSAGLEVPALLLAGAQGWDDDVQSAIDRASADLEVRALGYLPLQALPALLGDARLVAYPSLGEGFGLPVLEAMACGAAVVTTRRLSLPEVGGDAALYSGVDAPALAATIGEALLASTTALRERARTRAAEFTWERCSAVHEQEWTTLTRGRR